MEETGSQGERASGSGNLRAVVPGCLVTLERHPQNESNRQYLVTGAHLRLQDIGDASAQQEFECRVDFEVIPTSKVYRASAPAVPRPRTTGPQTAIVTGPAGREIWTDAYGRVKLSFHWNRYCTKDENSSCWVRVSSPWAGTNFGGIQIPRIGQEVIVDFEHGDPDRPIVTGRVYNADNMPPWDLPANATQSGLLTRSSEGASDANANALRFEDKKGAEQLWLHAERNQDIEVEKDETHWVGHDRTKTIDNDETVHVKHDRTETVDHDETITVHNDRTETVDGNETITIHKNRTETVDLDETITVHKNRTETVDLNETIGIGMNRTEKVGLNETINIGEHRTVTIGGAKMETIALAKAETIGLAKALTIGLGYQITVGAAMNTSVALMQTEQVGQSKRVDVGKTLTMNAGDRIELVCGKSSLVMTSDGAVTISGSTFDFSASGPVQITGKDIDLN
jgi:type VI secretion system secreted protein VgrG